MFGQLTEALVNNRALYYGVGLQLHSQSQSGESPSHWWTVGMVDPVRSPVVPTLGLAFNTVSDRIAPSFITSSFASYGVVAIYVTVGYDTIRMAGGGGEGVASRTHEAPQRVAVCTFAACVSLPFPDGGWTGGCHHCPAGAQLAGDPYSPRHV